MSSSGVSGHRKPESPILRSATGQGRHLKPPGYDPHAMLLEWEIFWRRKGL